MTFPSDTPVGRVLDREFRPRLVCAALSRTQRRSTILLAVLSSFSCPLGGGCRPAGNLRVRTGGGPGFFPSGVGKWRAMENVLHGGAAKMAK